ncbi:phosphoribosylamine--glycine ligase [bacterium BMS3Bbin12]|nr:phosphoribosylamine--glycine ligase [bacterium BMS3Bbin12]GBE50297.1 phosphoribosylamine--glycine ligase [bacterium BMS3Bbin13]
MKLLVVGGGGREHALAWCLARSSRVAEVLVAPGNAGTAHEPKVRNAAVAAGDIGGLLRLARAEGVDLTVIGPEAPLVAGIVDAFADTGLRCFGPRRAAAGLEGSKVYAKDFLARHDIPTAAYRSFTDAGAACAWIREHGAPLVVKADGLAAGKGVTLAHSVVEAEAAVRAMLEEGAFGAAGRRVVVEEFLEGEEASFMCLVDGAHVLPLASSQDHKARDEGDTGPNTGGMGAYSPAPVITPALHERILREVIEPTVRGLAADGRPFTGFLYAGLMIGADGTPRVLEYNVRLGDPETQPILLRLRSDLVDLLEAALDGRLDHAHAEWDPRTALGVVLAAGGYPGAYRKGDAIEGLSQADAPDTKVFHAGTALRDGRVVTNGGRVLCACALGATVAEAREHAYALAARIHWDGVYYRRDIGHRALARG